MAGGNREPGRTVTSKVIAVLGAFEHTMRPLGVTEIAELADLPPSTTHRLVSELTEGGLLSKKSDGRYQLGLRIWDTRPKYRTAVTRHCTPVHPRALLTYFRDCAASGPR